MGIEPTWDASQRPTPDLKSGSPTSELGTSLVFCGFCCGQKHFPDADDRQPIKADRAGAESFQSSAIFSILLHNAKFCIIVHPALSTRAWKTNAPQTCA